MNTYKVELYSPKKYFITGAKYFYTCNFQLHRTDGPVFVNGLNAKFWGYGDKEIANSK
jgi:hypothetical protein